MRISANLKPILGCIFACMLLASCGGGGGDGGGGTPTSGGAPPATPVAPPLVQSVQPQEADAGGQVTISGSGLTRISMVTVGGAVATIVSQSETQLVFTVPGTAPSGPLVLAGAGFSVQAAQNFRVFGLPTVTSVSATNAPVSGSLIVTGTNLDRAPAFSVGGLPLAPMTVSATTAMLRAPSVATAGALRIQDRSGVVRDTPHLLTIWRPMSILSVTPAAALPGDLITISGDGLEHLTEIGFASTPLTALQSLQGYATTPESKTGTVVMVRVPPQASTGQIAVRSPFEPTGVVSQTVLTVQPRVSVSRMSVLVTPATP